MDLREEVGQEGQQQDLAGMVETSTGRKVAEEFGAEYFECSAKTGCMVEEAFIATATKVQLQLWQESEGNIVRSFFFFFRSWTF